MLRIIKIIYNYFYQLLTVILCLKIILYTCNLRIHNTQLILHQLILIIRSKNTFLHDHIFHIVNLF